MIALRAKDVEFEVTYINLQEKPDWFLKLSPHGKVPVLVVDDVPLFESNAIAEYLDEVVAPRLHPEDPIERARNRAWTDFVPDFAKGLSGIYYTKNKEDIQAGIDAAPGPLGKLEAALKDQRGNDGPYFNGDKLSLVDAAYAPFFQRFAFVEKKLKTGVLKAFPLVQAWSDTLLASDQVTGSVVDTFEDEFVKSLKRRGFYVGSLYEENAVAAE
ncbi:MAG: glutathione S-transferase family protein [Alphaproteobacteria bacterium]|nr:glutathione S-transferase family protein [Alphaproteobacteria bacterium]